MVVTDEMLRQAQERTGGKTKEDEATSTSVLERLDDKSPVDPSDL